MYFLSLTINQGCHCKFSGKINQKNPKILCVVWHLKLTIMHKVLYLVRYSDIASNRKCIRKNSHFYMASLTFSGHLFFFSSFSLQSWTICLPTRHTIITLEIYQALSYMKSLWFIWITKKIQQFPFYPPPRHTYNGSLFNYSKFLL